MSELSIKNADSIEELQLKVKELKPNESVYVIEIGDTSFNSMFAFANFLEKKQINFVFVRSMPNIKELKKNE